MEMSSLRAFIFREIIKLWESRVRSWWWIRMGWVILQLTFSLANVLSNQMWFQDFCSTVLIIDLVLPILQHFWSRLSFPLSYLLFKFLYPVWRLLWLCLTIRKGNFFSSLIPPSALNILDFLSRLWSYWIKKFSAGRMHFTTDFPWYSDCCC